MKLRYRQFALSFGLAATLVGASFVGAQDELDPESDDFIDDPELLEIPPDEDEIDPEADFDVEIDSAPPTIEATIQDINALIELEREADEDPNAPQSIFVSEEATRELLGDAPAFVYIPDGVDPMIIPWVREQIVINEKVADARNLLQRARGQVEERNIVEGQRIARQAKEILDGLKEQFPEASAKREVQNTDRDLQGILAMDPTVRSTIIDTPVERDIPIELPTWIKVNTKGVLIDREDPGESIALVGDFIVKAGQPVEQFPRVVVKEILPQQVIYEFEDNDFLVPVISDN